MQNRIRAVLSAALLSLLTAAAAFAQTAQFPQTLPAGTVWGRLGISPGPGQAIPFATLAARIAPTNILYPSTYGAVCDGATDDTAAFVRLAAAASTAKSVQIEFPKNSTCVVLPTDASATAVTYLMNFSGMNRLVINFNGSSLHSLYTGAVTTITLKIDTSSDVDIYGYNHTSARGKQSGAGVIHIYITNSHAVRIHNARMTGGTIGVDCVRAAGSATARSYDISVDLDATDVYYPGSFQFDCDNVRGTFKSQNAGRPYFPYNVKDHDVTVIPTNQTSQLLIKSYATALDTSSTTGMKVRVIDTASTVCATAPLDISWSQYNPAVAAVPGNIDLDLEYIQSNANCSGTTYNSYVTMDSQTNSGGSTILGDASHTGNIKISGSVVGNTAISFMELATAANGFGANNAIKINAHDIRANSVTRPLLVGVGANMAFGLDSVTAPSSTLTFDSTISGLNFQAFNTRLANISPADFLCGSNYYSSSFARSGTLTCDNSSYYLRSAASRSLKLGAGDSDWLELATTGEIAPITTNTSSLGTTALKFANLYSVLGNIGTLALTNPLTVPNGGTGIASGTSGGVPYFSSTTAIASSGLLTANGVVLGGGAGATPTATTAGTNGQMLLGQTSAAPSWNTMSGDCTLAAAGAITCTKVNGVTYPSSVTSGGVLYASSTSAVASSALLTANAIVLGGGAGAAPAALGSLGTSTTLLHGNASGAPTFGAVVSADMNITTTSCTNQFVSAISAGGVGTCTTDTLAGAQHANQGTSTTVLHGNASGNPSWGQVAIGSDVSGLGTGVATFLATPSSANLAAALTDETGSGAAVFATSPTLTTPTIGVATATSVNKVAITAPASSATLTIADGTTLTQTTSTSIGRGEYQGIGTSAAATAGNIGELVTSEILVGSAVSVSNNTATNVTSISLTAGQWLVYGNVQSLPAAGTTLSRQIVWTSSTSATLPTIPNKGAYQDNLYVGLSAGSGVALGAGVQVLNLNATTTVYLGTFMTFSVSTMTAYGYIGATRLR